MTILSDGALLERRKKVRLRARPDLQSEARFQGGRRVFVVKDPLSLKYFHLEQPQFFALEKMDGTLTLDAIQREFEKQHKPHRLSLDELEAFAAQLLQNGLVHNETSPAPGKRLYHHFEKHQAWQRWLVIASIFFYKIPLVHPNRMLDRLVPLGRVLFHPLGVFVAALLLAGALCLIVTRWDEFLNRLPAYQELFTWQNILYLWLALGVVKILHELGHALCARTFGGEVHDVGIVLLFFFPTLYCDVTDTWMLPQKWKRLAISAAGIYVELTLAAAATFVWWAAEPATFISDFSFWLLVVCSLQTLLFNANPLMRFDGYFILSDWLELPNLAQAASRYALKRILGCLGIEIQAEPAAGSGLFLFVFGVASFAYRMFALGLMLYGFCQITKEHRLAWLGLSLSVTTAVAFVALPIYRLCSELKKSGKVADMKGTRLWLILLIVSAGAAVVFLAPFPVHVRGVGLVQVASSHQNRVTVPASGGFLTQVLVRDGQQIKKGDTLAVLTNPQLDLDVRMIEADQALRIEQGQTLIGQLALFGFHSHEKEGPGEIQQELRTLAQQAATIKSHRDALILRAPCDGVIMGLPSWEMQGKWLPGGTSLCQIGDPGKLRLLVLVDPADRQLLEGVQQASFHSYGAGAQSWPGQVTGVAQVDADEIPPQLSQRLGGEVVTTQDPVSHSEKPRKQHYLVSVDLTNPDSRLQVGALGQVRIDAGANTLWWRARRYLGTTFNMGL